MNTHLAPGDSPGAKGAPLRIHRKPSVILGVAGMHVYSEPYRLAALGNATLGR